MSDVKVHLTQRQYCGLIKLLQEVPRAFVLEPDGELDAVESSITSRVEETNGQLKSDLQPELDLTKSTTGERVWTTVDVSVNLGAVKLHIYDSEAQSPSDLKEHGIARFALNNMSLSFKMLSDSAMEAELAIKSLTMGNTKPGSSKHREILPAAAHDRNQLMILYTSSGGNDPSSVAIVTLDSPRVIFSLDPVFALSAFFMSAFPSGSAQNQEAGSILEVDTTATAAQQKSSSASSIDLRFDLHDATVSILEDDSKADSQAVQFSVKQLSLSHQVLIYLNHHQSSC